MMESKSNIESMPIMAAFFHKNCFTITLREDRPDFWVFLGPHVGWGRFQNTRRAFPGDPANDRWMRWDKVTGKLVPVPDAEAPPPPPPPKEVRFVIVEVRPASDAPPHPIVVSSNVLWRKQEALEAYLGQLAYLAELERFEQHRTQEGQ